ncbi:MAG: penicillin-binding protein 2 [Pseudomonadota bacterium]|nr:penicillin-binding protein 2 [Pseudomonadota bacterium]
MPLFDRKDKSRYATFTRRTLMVSGAMGAVFATLAGRLYQLQVIEGGEFKAKAEDNRVSVRLLAPPRGRILDRFAVALADNRRNYRVLLIPEQASDGVKPTLAALARVIVLSDRQREKILRDVAENKRFVPVTVAENLSWDEFARINLHLPYLPGVQPDVGETRAYPYGAELSHILGYVAAVSPDDKKNDDDPLLDLPGFRIGKRGIEKEFNSEIRGTAGTERIEVNAYGREIRELSRDPGISGADIYLTIDYQVQEVMAKALGDQSAAAAVMDVETGDVIALSSTPGFDPNLFNVGITTEEWQGLTTNDHTPLMNKAISGVYPPGSTFKPLLALAGFDAGIATPDFTVFCSGTMTLGNHEFHCWKHNGHGVMNLTSAIEQSCDIFFYELSRRVGIDRIDEAAHALGLGQPTGIELPGERAGLIPSRAWKRATFGQPWEQGETLVTGIGQGFVLATPLQLCTEAARIASGKAVSPRITRFVGHHEQQRPKIAPLGFSDAAIAAVRTGMAGVCNTPGGTAYSWRISEPGFEMAGKTGTAQVRRITREERLAGLKKNDQMPWNLREHALFIAYAPLDKPRYACAVVIEHGADPNHYQVQMARDILLFAQKRDPVNLPAAYPVAAASIGRKGR